MFSSSLSLRMGLSWIWQDSVCVIGSPLFRSGVVHTSISDHCVCRSLCLCLTICAPDSHTNPSTLFKRLRFSNPIYETSNPSKEETTPLKPIQPEYNLFRINHLIISLSIFTLSLIIIYLNESSLVSTTTLTSNNKI